MSMIIKSEVIKEINDHNLKDNKLRKKILFLLDGREDVLNFLNSHFNFDNSEFTFLNTYDRECVSKELKSNSLNILNFHKINDFRFLNKYFEKINFRLVDQGLFFGFVETYPDRRRAIISKSKYPVFLNWIIYFVDYIFNRLAPKIPIVKSIYFNFTKGKSRVLSRAESYGRLYSCGFEIVDEFMFDNSVFFIAKKVSKPLADITPTYGFVIKLRRIGKDKKIIDFYKLRTMHPFSEYLQEYIYKKNNLTKGGKISNDFRISPEGRIFRKFWLDELPMLYNWFKGHIKLVGVRPISEHYFNLYSKELQEMRIKYKPGLIPPFYYDLPKSFNDIMKSEMNYLKAYEKNPILTDLKYLFHSLINIFFKRARSQ